MLPKCLERFGFRRRGLDRGRLLGLMLAAMVLGVAASALQSAELSGQTDVFPDKSWQKLEQPQQLGWSQEKLEAAKSYADSIHSAAVLLVHHGKIVTEWGPTEKRFNVHSIRKSFLSALAGIYVEQGKICMTDTLEKLGIEDNEPRLTAIEKQATVADLFKARSGVYHPALYETEGMKKRRPLRGSHLPGTFWYYNNWDFNVLGSIVEEAIGESVFTAFKREIAVPLNMEDFRLQDTEYVRGPDSDHPAYPFRMTARDMARFGLLFARGGRWRDKQIIPRDWVIESTTSHSPATTEQGKIHAGYGYLWWTEIYGRHLENVDLPPGVFSARGAGGHYILVVPAWDLVVVHRVDTDNENGPKVDRNQFNLLVKQLVDAMPAAEKKAPSDTGETSRKRPTATIEAEQPIEAVFTARIVNRGDEPLHEPHLAMHLPMDLPQQTVAHFEIEGCPERKVDRWNAPIAIYERKELAPKQVLTGRWIAQATVRQLHWELPRQDNPRAESLSAAETELYLRDAANYNLKHETLANAYREAVEGRMGTRDRLEGIFDAVMNRLVYDRDGKWEAVPEVLASGKGSCSEYTYCFIALCRLGGIPVRYVGGITGRASQPYFLDTVYHRCPQAYVPGLGWVDFDPTRTDRAKDKRRFFGRSSPLMLLTCVGDGGEGSLTAWDYLETHHWKDEHKKAQASGFRMGWWFPPPPSEVKRKVAAFRRQLAESADRGGLVEEALAIDHPYVLPWLDDLLYDPSTRVEAAKACIKIGGDGVLRGVCNSLGRLADAEGDRQIGELLEAFTGQKFGADRAKWNAFLKKNIPPSSL